MKDSLTLAYLNMFAVLKDLEKLCQVDEEARRLAQTAVSVGFNVRNGPKATLSFGNGACRMTEGNTGRVKLYFTSPAHFNGMIDGLKKPLPYAGLTKLSFLTRDFVQLTDILTKYLKAAPEALQDGQFRVNSTKLMFYLVANALSAVANQDPIGRVTAQTMPDGVISLEIEGREYARIIVKDHRLTTLPGRAEQPRAYMIFADYETARGLFDGSLEAMSCLAAGRLSMKGYVPLIDNLNRVLNRVAVYLG